MSSLSSRAYIAHGNLYFVPVLRQRLAFAALVRRSLHELNGETSWSATEDLIAVVLPPSVRTSLAEAIGGLPRVSLLLATMPGAGAREVFPVTPCDAMVEAARVALEHDYALEFIDLETAPGNLLRGPCLRDPMWPDDSLVDMLGPKRYLDLISAHFALPPARIEPLDTWREVAISERLRRLQPRWRRVLVICDAALVPSVRTRLRGETTEAAPPSFDPTRLTYTVVQQLRLEVLLGYLDDYPRLVERYEKLRYHSAHEFDKWRALRDAILDFADDNPDLAPSTRQHQTFHTLLANLLAMDRRRCPQPDVLHGAAASCFGRAFARRLTCHLAGYKNQIRVERVQPQSTSGSTLVRWSVEVDSSKHLFTGRACNPTAPPYFATSRPQRREKSEPGAEHLWLPEEGFHRDMYRKLGRLSARTQRQTRSVLYNGSIQMGVDVRRTLRASWSGRPSLFVKAFVRRHELLNLQHEPTVWVVTEDWDRRVTLGSSAIRSRTESLTGGRSGKSYRIGCMDIIAIDFERDRDRNLTSRKLFEDASGGRVHYYDRAGWISFVYDFESTDQARIALGHEFEQRSPDHADFEHPDQPKVNIDGCVHSDLMPHLLAGASWLEIALLTALRYAQTAVTLVAPPEIPVPAAADESSMALGKSIVRVPLSRFSREERSKLTTHYRYNPPPGSASDPDGAFADIMRLFWQ